MSVQAKRFLAERDGWICNGCGVSLKNFALNEEGKTYAVIDHKTPLSQGGSQEPENLWLLCNSCNSQKGKKTVEEWERSLDFTGQFLRKGFTAVPNALLERATLSIGARMTLICLMSFAWREAPFPGQKRLASMLGCSDRTVREYLAELRDAGFLRVQRRGRGKTNVYRIEQQAILSTEESSAVPRDDRKQASSLDRKQASYKEDEVEEDEVRPVAATPRNGRRNPIWDALTEVFGDATTETARSRRGKVCRSLLAAKATPDEIIRRARSWPRHFDDATLTELALEKHWDVLGRKPLRVTR